MVVMLLIANLASKERAVPALTHAQPHPDAEAFDTVVSAALSTTGNINPTTASILTSILGEQQSADQAQVNSAITTLSSGAFGAEVQRTMAAVEAANQTNIEPREAAPADEETGQTLERVSSSPCRCPAETPTALWTRSPYRGLSRTECSSPMALPVYRFPVPPTKTPSQRLPSYTNPHPPSRLRPPFRPCQI